MAIVWMDACATYTNGGGAFLDKYDIACAYSDFGIASDIRSGAYHNNQEYNHASYYTAASMPGEYRTTVLGMSFKKTSRVSDYCVSFSDGTTRQITITLGTDGAVSVRRGGPTDTVIAVSDTGLITLNAWKYFEFKLVSHATAGSVEFRINGVSVFSVSGLDTEYTTDAPIRKIMWYGYCQYTDIYVDDANFHALPGSGCRIDTLWPTGAGNYSQMTPSSGSNYECIDDGRSYNNTDDSVVSSGIVNEIDSYTFEDISAIGTDIIAVAHSIIARQDEVGTVGVSNFSRINGSDYVGDENIIETFYLEYQNIMELNPDDSLAWEEADINAAEFGQKRTT